MPASILKFVRDERGAIISAELIIILTVVVLALVVGWNAVAAALVGELTDVAGSLGSLNQSYSFRGVSAGEHATCSGSGFVDSGSTFNLSATSGGTSGGGGGGASSSFGSIAGGGGGSSLAVPRSAPAPSLSPAIPLGREEVVTITDSDETTVEEERVVIEEAVAALRLQLADIQAGGDSAAPSANTAKPRASNATCDEELRHVKKLLAELCAELQRIEAKSSRPARPVPSVAP